MPVAALVCPHCEHPVELQVTAVTRSRPCPSCGKHIMLQFAQKQGRMKRKALLINAKGGLDFDAIKNEIPVEEPQPLPGDAFDRMRADPELIAMKKRFAWSIGAVTALVLVATVFHLNRDRWFPQLAKPEPPPVAQNDNDAPEVKSLLNKESRIASAQRPEKKPESLDFTAQEQQKVASSANDGTSRLKVPPLTPNAPRIGAKNPIPGMSMGPAATPGAVKPLTTTKSGGSMIGALPKSLFRISTKGVTQVKHDLPKGRATLSAFLKAKDVNERLQYLAERNDVEARVRVYYEKNGDGPVAFKAIENSETVGNGTVSEHDVVLADGRVRHASVVKSGEASYSVDWPSFVGESEMEWTDLAATKPSKPVLLRVAAEPAALFEGDFSDSRFLLCIKLTHPAKPDAPALYGYVERQSGLGRELEYWLKMGESAAVPMTVRVKYPLVATVANQVWITELVSPGWVLKHGQPIVQLGGSAK